jgi:general stress protein CsbA
MGLILGCVDVSASQPAWKGYTPFTWFWAVMSLLVGAVFVTQTVQERRKKNG